MEPSFFFITNKRLMALFFCRSPATPTGDGKFSCFLPLSETNYCFQVRETELKVVVWHLRLEINRQKIQRLLRLEIWKETLSKFNPATGKKKKSNFPSPDVVAGDLQKNKPILVRNCVDDFFSLILKFQNPKPSKI